jgi:hypothetical protein
VQASPRGGSLFTPVPELNLSDAQIALLFLSSDGVWHRERTEDPWFAATRGVPISNDLDFENRTNVFLPDEPASVVGCTFKFWLCNPKLPGSPCRNMMQAGPPRGERLLELWPDTNDRAAILGFLSAVETFTASPDNFYRFPGLPSLLSRGTLVGPLQVDAIPPNRWQQEMEFTFQASLAAAQSSMAAAAQKGAIWSTNGMYCPTPEACHTLCHNQVSQQEC